jgi:hypothetical protein
MTSKLEEVLAISRALIALEKDEREIQEKILQMRLQLASLIDQKQLPDTKETNLYRPEPGTSGLESAPEPEGYGKRGGYGQRGITREVLDYMMTIPMRQVSPDDVAKAMDKPGTNEVISRILQRLAQSGKIERAHRGLYRFTPTPNATSTTET